MNYFKEKIQDPLAKIMPNARFISPNMNQKAMEMLAEYLQDILENDQKRDTANQNSEPVPRYGK
jgi:hypothetical protein